MIRRALAALLLLPTLACDDGQEAFRARTLACMEHGGALRVIEQTPQGFSLSGPRFLVCRDGFSIPWDASL